MGNSERISKRLVAQGGAQDALLEQIAKEHLLIDTLVIRGSDSLDFHDVSVQGVKDALQAAFDAGLASRNAPPVV